MKTYVFDIDGTVCSLTSTGDYTDCSPILHRIEKINKISESGDRVIFYTARGMGRSSNNPEVAHEQFYLLTLDQLRRWGINHNGLFMGKPSGDLYIDDKGIKDEDFFRD